MDNLYHLQFQSTAFFLQKLKFIMNLKIKFKTLFYFKSATSFLSSFPNERK